jgi:flagella basal body P-ring formation protein FlgA
MSSFARHWLSATALLVCWVAGLSAAELRLRSECRPAGPLVRLGDLADVFAEKPEQAAALRQIELFPSPVAPQQRFLQVRELQDLLILRGVNLAEHQFSGASQVAVQGVSQPKAPHETPEADPQTQAPSPSLVHQVSRRACEAVAQYLKAQAGNDANWIVTGEVDAAAVRLLANPRTSLTVAGGNSPWTGAQQFELVVGTARGAVRVPFAARVTVPDAVVVVTRSLPRGAAIHAGDVELQTAPAAAEGAEGIHNVEDVVGRETTRALPAGKVVAADAIRPALLVHRGEIVTVYARTSGITIRTTARCRDDGSQGDLVGVESLLDRGTFFARVSGIREVEVYGRGNRVDTATSGDLSGVVRR